MNIEKLKQMRSLALELQVNTRINIHNFRTKETAEELARSIENELNIKFSEDYSEGYGWFDYEVERFSIAIFFKNEVIQNVAN